MGGAARRRENRPVAAPATGGSCAFCGSDTQDETTVGRLYLLGSITVHYHCALLSCGLVQRGNDEEGLFGFLLDDILAELCRGKKLKCSYCSGGGATVACCITQCRKMFHLPCGRRRGSVSLFYGSYSSFCITHAPMQQIPESIMVKARSRKAFRSSKLRKSAKSSTLAGKETAEMSADSGEDAVCSICYEEVDSWPSTVTFWPPCCARDRWLHVPCIQRMALSAGMHYLKCPLCNDKETFQKTIASHGVYIPDRDASWELEGDAYADLYERPKSCSAEECKCYQGRSYDADEGRWELKLCLTCGSAASHAGCLAAPRYVCERCSTVPPPDNLEALENIPLPRPETESAAPEYHPLMSCRMSVRRTKPSAARRTSSSVAIPDYFKMDRVVKVVKSQLHEDDLDDVDVESIDQPCCSKTDKQFTSENGPEKANYSIIKWLLCDDRSKQGRMLDIEPKKYCKPIERMTDCNTSNRRRNVCGCLWRRLIKKIERSIEEPSRRNKVILAEFGVDDTNEHKESVSDVQNEINIENDIGNMLDESVICVDENETREINKSNNEVIEIESIQSLNEVIEIESNQSLDTLNYLGDDGVIDLTKSSLIRDRIQKWLERGSVNYPRNSLETNLAKGHVLIKNMPREIQDKHIAHDDVLDESLAVNKMLNQHITNDELLDKHITDDGLLDKHITNDVFLDKHITDDGLLDKHITNDVFLDKHITDDGLLDKHITDDGLLDTHITNNKVLDEHVAYNKMSVESNDATEGQLTDENPISENILDNKNEAHEKMLGKNENVNISSDKTDNQNTSSDSNHNEVLSSDNNFINEKISSKTNEEKIISGSNDTNGNISSDGKVSSESNGENKILYTKDTDEIVSSDSTGEALNEVGDSPKKAFDKSALTELEDKIISPLKMIEEKIYARLTGNDDGGFKQRIDDNVRRMKKPRPMSVKKKVIENILERLLEDCNSGAPTERDPEAADDRIKTEGSTTQEYQSHCNKSHSSISAPSVSPGNTQNSTVQHSVDIDLATDNIDLSSDKIDFSKNNVELSTDEIDLSIDNIVSPVKTLNTSTDSTKVEILKSALEISCQETVNIDYVRPSADALKVESVKERGRIIFGDSASETCEIIQKYSRKQLKTGLNLKKRRSNVSEDILIESLKFDCGNDDKVREGGKEKKSTDISPVRKWGAELSKTADLESFKSHYLSEVGQYKCNFTHKHKHEDTKESKPRIRTAIDYAIEAAVKQRRQTIEADAERAKISNEIDKTLDSNKKSILKDESVGERKSHDKVVKFKNTQSNKTLEGVDKEPANRNHVTKRRKSESENDAPNTVVKVITPRKSIEVLQNLITAFENSNTSSGNIVLPSLSALGADPDVSKKEIQNTDALPEKVFSREKRIVVLQDTALVHGRHNSEICVPKSGTSLEKPYSTPEKPVPTLEMPVSTLDQQIPLLDSLSMLDKPIQKFQNLISTVEKPPSEVENSISSVEKAKYKTMRPGVERQPLEKDVLKRGTVIKGMKKEFDKLNYVRLADKPHKRALVNEIDNVDDDGNFLVEVKELRRELLTENAPIRAKYRGDAKRRKRKRKSGVEKISKKARYQEELEAFNTAHSSRITTKINFENINDFAVKTKKGRRRKNKSYAKEIQKMKENEQLFDSLLTQNSARKTDAEKADEDAKLVEEKKANAKGEKRKSEKVEEVNEKSKEKKRLSAKRVEERTDTAKRTDFYRECDSEREKNRRCDKKIKVNKREESESNEKSSEDSKQQKYSEKRKSRGKTADNIREIRKNNCDETKKSKNNDKGKETVVETSEKQKTNKEKITMKSLNSEAGQEKKRKRRRVDYSDEHAFMGELDRVNEYYLKNIKRKKLNRSTETAKHVDTEPKLKQSILNFSPGGPKILSPPNDKEKTSHPISQKKKRKIHDFTADGLKQTTLNNFFSLHFTLT